MVASSGARILVDRIVQSSSRLHELPLVGPALARLRLNLDINRSRNDVPDRLLLEFKSAKTHPEYVKAFNEERPLVSVCVGTFNRSALLVRRCLRSLVAQTYEHLEIIVVGDCCTDDTQRAVEALGDARIVFVNLPKRGPYPTDPKLRWMVAGTMPFNHALNMAKGAFITHLDDDDEHPPQRIQNLLEFVQSTRADLVFHPFEWERTPGRWQVNQARDFCHTQVTTSSILYHRWFKNIPWDINAYKYREPGDWNRLRKFKYLGAKILRFPEPLLRHYTERLQHRR